jgi:uncharacterized membrane protein
VKKDKSATTQGTLIPVVATLLRTYGIRVPIETIETELFTHPDFPSLEAVRSAMERWRVPAMPVRLSPEKLQGVPLPAIAHLHSGDFVLVQAVGEAEVQFWTSGKGKQKISFQDFIAAWSGAMLLVSKPKITPEEKKAPLQNGERFGVRLRRMVAYTFSGVLASFALFSIFSVSWIFAGLACLKLVGLFFSVGLLQQSLGQESSSWFSSLCTIGKNTDCKAILQTKASKIFSWLSWAEVGFFYFSGGFLVLLLASWQVSPLVVVPFLGVLSLLALPYTFFSVYYQWRVAKQWCPLCLGVQVVLWLEFSLTQTLSKGEGFMAKEFLIFSFGVGSFSFLLPVAGWFLFSDIWNKAQKARYWRLQALRLHRNPVMFQALLRSQKKLQTPTDTAVMPLVLGKGGVQISIFTNPRCPPCAHLHQALAELLENVTEKIEVHFYFLSFPAQEQTTEELITAFLACPDEATKKDLLDAWYAEKQKIDILPTEEAAKICLSHTHFAQLNEIEGTPTVFVNGYQLPEGYALKNLVYHLKDF